jgi:hypothetical protein
MQFLNIFPSRLRVEKTTDDRLMGTLFFNFEQYGLLFNEQSCDVSFKPTAQGWHLSLSQMSDLDSSHFEKFTQALNHYVLSVLKFEPGAMDASVGQVVKELYFDDVFFDMSSEERFFKKVPKK